MMKMNIDEHNIQLIESGAISDAEDMSVRQILEWIDRLNKEIIFDVSKIPFSHMDKWHFDEHKNLVHSTGKFFSIRGIKIRTNYGYNGEWMQPIIYQPEIGILGILCQRQNGILKFLMQAKMEPGNVNKMQLSPTMQATKSNYTQVHGGDIPCYLEYFIDLRDKKIIVDQLQSEQGARFFKKRNRNMIIEICPEIKVPVMPNYCWLTLGQIKKLLAVNNMVNMDTRSVLSCIQLLRGDSCISSTTGLIDKCTVKSYSQFQVEILRSLLSSSREAYHSTEEVISWFTALKTKYELEVTPCNMDEIDKWEIGDESISHVEGKYFKVIAVNVTIQHREVRNWSQPLIEQREDGIIGFIIKKINNTYHILVQAKMEVGNFDVLEMAPTVQCITGSYKKPEYSVPYLQYFIEQRGIVKYDAYQSEEGGRFYHEQNRNIVLEVGDEFSIQVEANYIWMTFRQAKEFIKYNNYFNVEARSLMACISPV